MAPPASPARALGLLLAAVARAHAVPFDAKDFFGPPLPVKLGGPSTIRKRPIVIPDTGCVLGNFHTPKAVEKPLQNISDVNHAMLRALYIMLDGSQQDGNATMEDGYAFVEKNLKLVLMRAFFTIQDMWDRKKKGVFQWKELDWDMEQSGFEEKEKPVIRRTFEFLGKSHPGDDSLSRDEAIRFIYFLRYFRERDMNMDGVVTRDEWVYSTTSDTDGRAIVAKRRQMFTDFDTDQDGLLDPDELFDYENGAYKSRTGIQLLHKAADLNGDGLTLEELTGLRDRAVSGEVKWNTAWYRQLVQMLHSAELHVLPDSDGPGASKQFLKDVEKKGKAAAKKLFPNFVENPDGSRTHEL